MQRIFARRSNDFSVACHHVWRIILLLVYQQLVRYEIYMSKSMYGVRYREDDDEEEEDDE